MAIEVVPADPAWPAQFRRVEADLTAALAGVPVLAIEHVGSTSVPGLAAKPVLDIDIVVERPAVADAIAALERGGYRHRGDLGVTDREAFVAPDENPRRHVYVCVEGTLHLRNHLAVRRVLRENDELRDRYAAIKQRLASDPAMGIDEYLAGKSAVLQDILALSDLTSDEKEQILRLNTGNTPREDPTAVTHPLDDGPFYHGTRAELGIGEQLTAGHRSNYRPEITMNHVYFTALRDGAGLAAEIAAMFDAGAEPHVYLVRPTGAFEDDPNVTDKKYPGNPTRSFRTQSPLVIVEEVTDWTRQTPEALAMWRERITRIRDERGEIIN